jgi:hypothetical protein
MTDILEEIIKYKVIYFKYLVINNKLDNYDYINNKLLNGNKCFIYTYNKFLKKEMLESFNKINKFYNKNKNTYDSLIINIKSDVFSLNMLAQLINTFNSKLDFYIDIDNEINLLNSILKFNSEQIDYYKKILNIIIKNQEYNENTFFSKMILDLYIFSKIYKIEFTKKTINYYIFLFILYYIATLSKEESSILSKDVLKILKTKLLNKLALFNILQPTELLYKEESLKEESLKEESLISIKLLLKSELLEELKNKLLPIEISIEESSIEESSKEKSLKEESLKTKILEEINKERSKISKPRSLLKEEILKKSTGIKQLKPRSLNISKIKPVKKSIIKLKNCSEEQQFIISKMLIQKNFKLLLYLDCNNKKINNLDSYLEFVYNSYIQTKEKLSKVEFTKYKNSKDYSILGNLIGDFNNEFNNINYSNYGSEASLLDTIPLKITYDNLFSYVNSIKKFDNKKFYTINDYFKKIGTDLAIILFIFTDNLPDLVKENIIIYFKDIYETYFEILNKKKYLLFQHRRDAIEEYKKIIKDPNYKDIYKEFDNDKIIKCQEEHNLFLYPYKIFNDIKYPIYYINNVILRFKD